MTTPELATRHLSRSDDFRRVHHFVDGERVLAPSAGVHLLDPLGADGHRFTVPVADADEVEAHLLRCSAGLARWLALGSDTRDQHLRRLAVASVASTLAIADAISDDFGIRCVDAVAIVRQLTEQALRREPPHESPHPVGLHVVETSRELPGLRALVTVWPLIHSGSVVVLHPSMHAPRSVSFIAEMASDAGLPDGVLAVIHGDAATREAIASSPHVVAVHRDR